MGRIIFLTLLFLITQVTTSYSDSANFIHGPIRATVVKVLDGDTLEISADIWLNQNIQTKIRISGIDTPELKGKCDFERNKAIKAKEEIIRLINNNEVTITNIRYGKYAGRVLGDVITKDGVNLADYMLSQGLARSYHGKKRDSWCG